MPARAGLAAAEGAAAEAEEVVAEGPAQARKASELQRTRATWQVPRLEARGQQRATANLALRRPGWLVPAVDRAGHESEPADSSGTPARSGLTATTGAWKAVRARVAGIGAREPERASSQAPGALRSACWEPYWLQPRRGAVQGAVCRRRLAPRCRAGERRRANEGLLLPVPEDQAGGGPSL